MLTIAAALLVCLLLVAVESAAIDSAAIESAAAEPQDRFFFFFLAKARYTETMWFLLSTEFRIHSPNLFPIQNLQSEFRAFFKSDMVRF